MEGPVKGKQAFLHSAIALSLLAGLTGCKDDSATVSALEELTTQLSNQVAEQNKELSSLTEGLQTCMKDLATAKDEAVVIESSDATADVPSLEGEANLASLGALKQALNETIEKQKGALADLKAKGEQCAKDLQATQEAAEAEAAAAAEAEAAAAAEAEAAAAAAEEEAARTRAAAKKRAKEKKPTAVQEAEETGAPTKGTRSRY
jgi:chromosome segregation ATPase